MNYSQLIKTIREQLLLTQEELAQKLGVSFATINRWERGRHEPTMSAKRKLQCFCKQNGIGFHEGK